MKIKVDIDPGKILRERGMGQSDELQMFISSEVERLSVPYVPMRAGSSAHMVTQAEVEPGKITYPGPYAHYHYVGLVMVGRAPKAYTSRKLAHHGAPMRGPEWEKRMLADKAGELEASVENFIKSKGR